MTAPELLWFCAGAVAGAIAVSIAVLIAMAAHLEELTERERGQ